MTDIAAHHEKWSTLPAFPQWPYVMTDDDVSAWSDILYLRGLADAICGTRLPDAATAEVLADRGRSLEYDVHIFIAPWPMDRAEQLLNDWKG